MEDATNTEPIERLVDLVCPDCGSTLAARHQSLDCRGCGKSRPIRNGVPDFLNESSAPETKPRGLTGVPPGAAGRPAEDDEANPGRANWYRLIDLRRDSRVLDIEAGIGATAHALALRCGEVIAMETAPENIEFMQHRFQRHGLSNVVCLQSSIWQIPFASQSFDLVVLNGVLEQIGGASRRQAKRQQRAALRHVWNLLRPGGYVYLGVENRISWKKLANRAKDGQESGKTTHSLVGYRRMLFDTGFTSLQCHAAVPSYASPRLYVPMANNIFAYYATNFDPVRSGLAAAAAHWICGKLRVAKYLENCFILLARKEWV